MKQGNYALSGFNIGKRYLQVKAKCETGEKTQVSTFPLHDCSVGKGAVALRAICTDDLAGNFPLPFNTLIKFLDFLSF